MSAEELCKLAKTTAKVGSNTSINCKRTQILSATDFIARHLMKSAFPLQVIRCMQYMTVHHLPSIITTRKPLLEVTPTTLSTFLANQKTAQLLLLFAVLNSRLLFCTICFQLLLHHGQPSQQLLSSFLSVTSP